MNAVENLTQTLNLANQALQRAPREAIVHSPTETLAALLIGAQRICGWQAQLLATAAAELDEASLAELRRVIVAARQAAERDEALARAPVGGQA